MTERAVTIKVTGLVQGVYYRQSCRTMARSLDLVGWVRNLPDGTVEIRAQGTPEAVDRLIDWVWVGPRGASVRGVETESAAVETTIEDFFIQR